MRKNIFCIILISLVAYASLFVRAFEAVPEAYPEFYDSEEYGDIETALLQSEIITVTSALGDSVDLSKVVSAYKVYHYTDEKNSHQFIDELADNSGFLKNVSGEYHWMVITDENAAIKLVKSSNRWEVASFRHPSSLGKPSQDILRDAFKNAVAGIEIESVKAFEVADIYTTFLCVQTKETVYVVPFSSRPDFSLLENGKRYTSEEAGKILRTSDYYAAPLKPGQSGGGGTVQIRVWPFIAGTAALILIAAGIVFVLRKCKVHKG